MFKRSFLGLAASAVLVSACTGEIGDAPGLARFGSEPELSAALSASEGWRSIEASAPAFEKLEFEVVARPEVANINAMVAVGSQHIADSSDAAIKVRFAADGFIDVRDESVYDSDVAFPYEPGVWYEIEISADMAARTYDVRVGERNGPRQALITGAAFDSDAIASGWLTNWAAWSSQRAKLDIAGSSWVASGDCASVTCLSLGVECGGSRDGCGGTLACGGCTSGQACNSGVCDDDATLAPPPSCEPESCLSLGVECGERSDGCGGTLICGGCASGQTCTIGVCKDLSLAPPASCRAETCLSWRVECGAWSDGCGGILICGGCASGQACASGVCEDGPSAPPPSCEAESCLSLGAECGQRSNGCGGTLVCGGCTSGQTCTSGVCEDAPAPPPPACVPLACSEIGAICGTQSDGCDGTINCGSCAVGNTCSSGQCVPSGSNQFFATRTSCMRPCAIQFDGQSSENLSWAEVRDGRFVWDFNDRGPGSEGFLAAHVYETAGTYHVTLTIDGTPWASKTITVTDPNEVACVSPTSDWTKCPAGAEHYTSISAAMSGTGPNSHILLEGNASHGSLPSNGDANILFGAYDNSVANPAVTASNVKPKAGWSYQDLTITGSSYLFDGLDNGANILWHRVTATSSSRFASLVFDNTGVFVVDSDITGGDYAMYCSGVERLVIKDSKVTRTQSGQHTIRAQGCDHLLVQNSTITGPGQHTTLTVRGNTDWALVQGNFFNQWTQVNPQNEKTNSVQHYVVWERNTYDATNAATALGMYFVGKDMVVRNNVVYNNSNYHYRAATHPLATTQNIQFYNNTAFSNKGGTGVVCEATNCVSKNNLFYSTKSVSDCHAGGTQANNWCRAANQCVDPVDGDSDCHDPNFVSTNPSSPDFVRPGVGTRGIDAGSQTVPVWDDYDNVDRSMIDVGAVER